MHVPISKYFVEPTIVDMTNIVDITNGANSLPVQQLNSINILLNTDTINHENKSLGPKFMKLELNKAKYLSYA